MSLNRMRVSLVSVWLATLAAVVATRLAMGGTVTPGAAVELILLAGIPVAILFVIFRGAGPRNTTQMLYDVEHTAQGARIPIPIDDRRTVGGERNGGA